MFTNSLVLYSDSGLEVVTIKRIALMWRCFGELH